MIQLTDLEGWVLYLKTKYIIGIEYILRVKDDEEIEYSVITMLTGDTFKVCETPDEVLELIQASESKPKYTGFNESNVIPFPKREISETD